ncbi:MAG: 6-bladed beta-propeller [Bacteroidales bacterium]|nr:6-bladed beta-propeller [Bacteroidales bacterium]
MRKLFYLLILAAAVVSCNKSQEDNSGPQVIDIEKGLENRSLVKLSEYASAINYIPLESSLECMMCGDEYMKIAKQADKFYFYSEVSSAPVFCFNQSGKFIRFIGTQGRAANEFRSHVNDFTINCENGQMLIADIENNLLFYDSEGNYIRTASLPHDLLSFGDDYTIIHKRGGEYMFIGFNKCERDGVDIIKTSDDFIVHIDSCGRELERKPVGASYGSIIIKTLYRLSLKDDPSDLYYTDGTVNIRRADTIYTYNIEKDTLVMEYMVDYGKLQARHEDFKVHFLPKRTGLFLNADKFVIFSMLFSLRCFPDMDKKYIHSVFLYDKQSRKTTALAADPNLGLALEFCGFGIMPGAEKTGYAGFVNDLDGGAPFVPRYIKDGKMYQIMDAIRFMDLADKCKSPAMKKVAASMNEDSNPVLIEVVLKK